MVKVLLIVLHLDISSSITFDKPCTAEPMPGIPAHCLPLPTLIIPLSADLSTRERHEFPLLTPACPLNHMLCKPTTEPNSSRGGIAHRNARKSFASIDALQPCNTCAQRHRSPGASDRSYWWRDLAPRSAARSKLHILVNSFRVLCPRRDMHRSSQIIDASPHGLRSRI
jgi:hypothetical protein